MEKIVLIVLGSALLIAVTFGLIDRSGETASHGGSQQNAVVERLIQQIESLELEQRELRARLLDLEATPASAPTPTVVASAAPQAAGEADSEVEEPEPQRSRRDPQMLTRIEQSGLSEQEFDTLETRAYELYLETFEEEWLQRREAWLGSEPRPNSRQRLRQELGDDAYDRYLYANGSPNRVRVGRVMPGSAAQTAGLSEGDILLSYDGVRLFNFEDLRTTSYRGEPGEAVIVEVRGENGDVSQLVIPRGPMGISSSGGWREMPGT